MDNKFFISAAVVLTLAMAAFLAWNYLEIYENKKYIPPSSDLFENRFYALDRWLNETGHPVRVDFNFSPEKITEAREKTTVILAASCEWEDADIYFIPWIENGGCLTICLDYYSEKDIDPYLLEFLSLFGIEAKVFSEYKSNFEGEELPDFNWNLCFNIDEYADTTVVKDNNEYIRLAEISLGEGKLTAIGYPGFMGNYVLHKEKNARLTWELTGARASKEDGDASANGTANASGAEGENSGVLMVRSRNTYTKKTMFGKIMERGNLVPVGISALLLIVFGFWMVIPSFGLVFDEKPKNSRPIRERFNAEIRFLRKYRALDYYLETYESELQLTHEPGKYNYHEIIDKLRSVNDGTDKFKRRLR